MAPTPSSKVPAAADIDAARRRSALYGLDPYSCEIPHVGEPRPASAALRQLSAPVLDTLVSQIAATTLAVVLADRDGRIVHRDAPTSATLTAMDNKNIDVGFSLAESAVGTNGVGTSLETRRPAVVVGEDHFLESFQSFTCANAPIIDPITHRVEGTVGVLCPVDDTVPLLLPTALQLSAQITELLLDDATPGERFLLEQFLRNRRTKKQAIATVGDGVLIATPTAQRLLAGVDHGELWQHVRAVTRHGSSSMTEVDFDRTSSTPLRLRCRPVYWAGEVGGAIVEFVTERPTTHRPRPARNDDRLGELVGESTAWRTVVREARQVARLGDPVLVVGERGTGRLSVAKAIAERRGSSQVTVLDSAAVLAKGAREWILGATAALAPSTTVVLRRIDQLPDDVAAALAAVVARCPASAYVVATAEHVTAAQSGLAVLFDQLNVHRVDLPPLRDRRDDIGPLTRHMLAELGRHHVDPMVVGVLYRQPWPGNVTELRQALRSANAKARTLPLTVRHLPGPMRREPTGRPLSGLRQHEVGAIVAALESTSTRKEAAELLGISRATLYRRIDAYRLDPDLP